MGACVSNHVIQTIHRRLKFNESDTKTPSTIWKLTETSVRYQIDVMLAISLAVVTHNIWHFIPGRHEANTPNITMIHRMLENWIHIAKSSWRMRDHYISRYRCLVYRILWTFVLCVWRFNASLLDLWWVFVRFIHIHILRIISFSCEL